MNLNEIDKKVMRNAIEEYISLIIPEYMTPQVEDINFENETFIYSYNDSQVYYNRRKDTDTFTTIFRWLWIRYKNGKEQTI